MGARRLAAPDPGGDFLSAVHKFSVKLCASGGKSATETRAEETEGAHKNKEEIRNEKENR
jgi:hypothetical protein